MCAEQRYGISYVLHISTEYISDVPLIMILQMCTVGMFFTRKGMYFNWCKCTINVYT